MIDRVLTGKPDTFGFNALAEEYEDLVKAGIIDPVKVVRCALENASSVASLMLTTETMIAEAPKGDEVAHATAANMGMGGMGGGMPMM